MQARHIILQCLHSDDTYMQSVVNIHNGIVSKIDI